MKIYLASDHAGYELKEKIKEYLSGLSYEYEVVDKGPFSYDKLDDYPDFIMPAAKAVAEDKESFGIIFGYSGQGEAMCANRVIGIRSSVFYGPKEPVKSIGEENQLGDNFEIIKLTREHNNANMLSIGTRFVTLDEAKFAVELFLNTKFSGAERHIRRILKY